MYKLLIVDDEPLVQVGIKSLVDWSLLDVEICGSAMNGQTAYEIICNEHPDIVISDIKMPVMDGLQLLKKTRENFGSITPVFIMLTSYEDFHLVKEAMASQAFLYLLKLELTADSLREHIAKAISFIKETSPSGSSTPTQSAQVGSYSYKEKFLVSLLNNLFESREQMELQAEDLNIDLSYAGYVCCYGTINGNNISSALDMLEKLISKYYDYYLTDLDYNHFALIICFHSIPEGCESDGNCLQDQIQQDIYKNLNIINNSLKNYMNADMFCGIGTFETLPISISKSFQYSRTSFRHADESSPVCYINMQDILPHDVFNISLFSGDLTRALEEYSSELLNQTINSLIDLLSEYPDHYVQAVDAASNILYMSISLLKDGESVIADLFSTNPDGYMSLYRLGTVSEVVGWLKHFATQLSQLFDERRKDYKNRTVMDVKEYIQAHITEKLSLNEVAAQFGISPSYLSQLFGKYNDSGFSEYINTCKVNRAKEMLVSEGCKVYEVADALGFKNEFYFSKVFKKIEGVSPSDYLNKINR